MIKEPEIQRSSRVRAEKMYENIGVSAVDVLKDDNKSRRRRRGRRRRCVAQCVTTQVLE
jgi:hypothetical protein